MGESDESNIIFRGTRVLYNIQCSMKRHIGVGMEKQKGIAVELQVVEFDHKMTGVSNFTAGLFIYESSLYEYPITSTLQVHKCSSGKFLHCFNLFWETNFP